jgi:hypothetical protein
LILRLARQTISAQRPVTKPNRNFAGIDGNPPAVKKNADGR